MSDVPPEEHEGTGPADSEEELADQENQEAAEAIRDSTIEPEEEEE